MWDELIKVMRRKKIKKKPRRPDKQGTRFYVKYRGRYRASVRKVWKNREGEYFIIFKGEKIDVSHLRQRFMRLDDYRMRSYRNTMQSNKMRERGRRRV